jgi:hypothetical protein
MTETVQQSKMKSIEACTSIEDASFFLVNGSISATPQSKEKQLEFVQSPALIMRNIKEYVIDSLEQCTIMIIEEFVSKDIYNK